MYCWGVRRRKSQHVFRFLFSFFFFPSSVLILFVGWYGLISILLLTCNSKYVRWGIRGTCNNSLLQGIYWNFGLFVTASQIEKGQSGAFNEATKSREKRRKKSSTYQAERPFVYHRKGTSRLAGKTRSAKYWDLPLPLPSVFDRHTIK